MYFMESALFTNSRGFFASTVNESGIGIGLRMIRLG